MGGGTRPNREGVWARLRRLLGVPAGRRCAPEADLFSAIYDGDVGCAAELLEGGADPNAADRNLATPLHYAAYKGHPDVVELLIRHKADVNARDARGNTPLHYAAGRGHKQHKSKPRQEAGSSDVHQILLSYTLHNCEKRLKTATILHLQALLHVV
jgi:ankyrin repeat protein